MTATEIEYEQVYNLLKQRKSRQSRDGKAHLLDNLKAKKGMRDLKEIGRVFAYMGRGKREKMAKKPPKIPKKCNLNLISSYEEISLILKSKGGCTSQYLKLHLHKCLSAI